MEKNEYMKEATYSLSADKIFQKIQELEKGGKTEEYKKRWLWELTQNAKDCVRDNEGISINVTISNNSITFSHDGIPFNFNNIMDLILQKSSKRNENSKTGKFGTGFISTHLISKKVKITGNYIDSDETIKTGLNIIVDRDFSTLKELESKLKKTIENLDDFCLNETDSNVCNTPYQTTFHYQISNTDVNLIKDSLIEFYKMAPFVLAFNKDIKKIVVNENGKEQIIEVIDRKKENDVIEFIKIEKEGSKIIIIKASRDEISVATKLEKQGDKFYCSDVREYPKLFCDFPMIGTEKFSFPLIINSKTFDMKQERNGIYPESNINKEILDKSIELYGILLDTLSNNVVYGLYHCCYIEDDKDSFQKDIYQKVKNIFMLKSLVWINETEKLPLVNPMNEILHIPYMTEKDSNLWDFISSIFDKIPIKEENLNWLKIFPENKWDIKDWAHYFQNNQEIDFLIDGKANRTEKELTDLNNFYKCWIEQKGEDDFIRYAPILCQNTNFSHLQKNNKSEYLITNEELYYDNDIDESLKEVYNSFFLEKGESDIRSILVDKRIDNEKKVFKKTKTTKDLADKISNEVRKLLSEEQSKNIKRQTDTQKKYNKLTDWFNSNPSLAKELFLELYEKSYNLTNHEEMRRRLKNSDRYEELIKETGKTEDEIIQIIKNQNLVSLKGQEYLHEIVHNIYSAEKYQELRIRSIQNVYNKLKEKSDIYIINSDISEWKKSIDNIFQVKKIINDQEVDIRIVVRPADNDKIIFYEQVELEAMDELSYELWIDDGKGVVKSISLAELIVMTGINMIPLNRIINQKGE